MKNLKKVLALVLAFACAFTMFAGAAFTDSADIKATEAVDTLVALGVIKGYEDGSFRPDATVTRAEMAKMIYVLRTGKDDASAYAAAATKFDDLNGASTAWAAGYIKYCEALGIIAGKSATKFDPAATVTGEEAAKMLLVTLGYDAEKAGLIGTNWAKTTIALADENGLLDDVNAPMSLALPRQYAAQMMFNAVDAHTVKLTDGEYSNMNIIGTYYPTMGEKYMGLKKTVGSLTSVVKTDGKSTYELTIANATEDSTNGAAKAVVDFKGVVKDYSSLKHQQVKVLYKANDNVYGVYATKDNMAQSGLLGNLKMDDAKVKLSTSYSIDTKSTVWLDGEQVYMKAAGTGSSGAYLAADFGEKSTDFSVAADIATWVGVFGEGDNASIAGKGSKVELLSTDGNTKMDTLRVTTFSVEKVTYVGKDYINANGVRKAEKFNYPSDIKKDDYVVISAAGNYADAKGLIEKATTVEGKVTAVKGDDKAAIDGTWYTMNVNSLRPTIDSNVKLILVNGYAYAKDTVTAGSADVVLVAKVANGAGVDATWQARVVFADGSVKVVNVDKVDNNTPATVDEDAAFLATYTVSKDKYTFTTVSKDNKAGYASYATGDALTIDGSAKGSITVDGVVSADAKVYFDANTVAYVRYDKDSYKVLKGTDVKGWNSTTADVDALVEMSSGNKYAKVAFIDRNTDKIPGGSNKTYAVALDSSYTEKVDGTNYTMVKAWNGTEEVTYKIDGAMTFVKGTMFEYSVDSENITDATILVTNTTESQRELLAQVKSYDVGTGDIAFNKTITATSVKMKITKDTKVLYVDSDGAKGVGDGEIRVAEDTDGKGVKDNVSFYIEKGDDHVALIVVDVNNNMAW